MPWTGKKVKDLRKKYGLTQSQLAAKLYVTVFTVSRWENDARGIPGVRADQLDDLERNLKSEK